VVAFCKLQQTTHAFKHSWQIVNQWNMFWETIRQHSTTKHGQEVHASHVDDFQVQDESWTDLGKKKNMMGSRMFGF